MTKENFLEMIKNSVLEVTFKKIAFINPDEITIETLQCTIKEDEPSIVNKNLKSDAVVVFDIIKKQWRTFVASNIIKVEVLETSFGLIQE